MSKKEKMTLTDLNAFLKGQTDEAHDGDDFISKKPKTLVEVSRLEGDALAQMKGHAPSEEVLAAQIQKLAEIRNVAPRMVLLDLIIHMMENQAELNASDIMLLNTALYVQHTEENI
jgi:hypothetical protein